MPELINTGPSVSKLFKGGLMVLGVALFLSAPAAAQTETSEPDEVTSEGGGPGPITADGGGPGPIIDNGTTEPEPILSDDPASAEEGETPSSEDSKKGPKPKKSAPGEVTADGGGPGPIIDN